MGCKIERNFGAVAEVNRPSKLASVPCRFYELGKCAKGAACQFFHDPNIDPAIQLAKGAGKEGKVMVPGCLFCPRVAEGLEAYHLQAYFAQFGKLNDIFGPLKKTIASIAYVRFADPESAAKALSYGEDHYVRERLMVRVEQCYEREGEKGKGKGPQRRSQEDLSDVPAGERRFSYGSGGLSVGYGTSRNNPY